MLYEEMVVEGAKFLDANYADWEQCINLDELNMFSNFDCVLGQLEGNFIKAGTKFSPTFDVWQVGNGFYIDTTDMEENEAGKACLDFGDCWKEFIQERLEAHYE